VKVEGGARNHLPPFSSPSFRCACDEQEYRITILHTIQGEAVGEVECSPRAVISRIAAEDEQRRRLEEPFPAAVRTSERAGSLEWFAGHRCPHILDAEEDESDLMLSQYDSHVERWSHTDGIDECRTSSVFQQGSVLSDSGCSTAVATPSSTPSMSTKNQSNSRGSLPSAPAGRGGGDVDGGDRGGDRGSFGGEHERRTRTQAERRDSSVDRNRGALIRPSLWWRERRVGGIGAGGIEGGIVRECVPLPSSEVRVTRD
jgi:hypothetical protein